jgi:hypothetical protein
VQATGGSGAMVTYTPPTATDQVGGASAVTCMPPPGNLFAVGTTTVTCTASDASGNQSQTTFSVNVTPPQFGAPCASTAECGSGTCVDGVCCNTTAASCGQCQACNVPGSVGTCAPSPICSPQPYEWSGILQPIDADGSSVFKLGSTVPVKFRLIGASAGITNLVANLSVAKVTSFVTGTDIEAVSTAAATTGNAFRYDAATDQYIFNLSTKSLSKGTWRLSIDMHDGVARFVNISLK